MTQPHTNHIPVLDHLRGLAALLVFGCHFGPGFAGISFIDPLVALSSYGERGVEMFFAISGFVIPYSMYQRGHQFRQSGIFLLRRMTRLEPPYLACIALILCLNGITQIRAGVDAIHPELQVTFPQVLAHFGYLNALCGYRWLNVVFWTLAIEFQYYLFAVVAYPGISSPRLPIRVISLIAIALLGFVGTGTRFDHPPLLPYWLPLFALGMTTFCLVTRQLDRVTAGLILLVIVAIAVAVNGVVSMAFALAPLAIIMVLHTRQPWAILRPLAWVGTFSYSFYLLHLPIGLRVQAHLRGILDESLSVILTFAVTLGCSYLFYRVIEKPAQQWSKSIGRHPRNVMDNIPSVRPRWAASANRKCNVSAEGAAMLVDDQPGTI